jgi:metallo-beta-lactamase family protein
MVTDRMRITFLGAVGTVTGSKFLVESEGTRLLVDCGLYQGLKQLRLRNWIPLELEPDGLDAVLLTHAHIDHSGYLPAVIRDGFSGPVFCTPPTRALCEILLPDSGRLHEEDARYANRKKFSRHEPALPLFTEDDAKAAVEQLQPVSFHEEIRVGHLTARFVPAGHILGASSVEISDGARTVLFSGDLGRSDDLLMDPPEPPGKADWIVMESTYGDRSHGDGDPVAAIAEVLVRTA